MDLQRCRPMVKHTDNLKGNMTHLQNIVGVLKRNKLIVMFMTVLMANYEIVEFIFIMQSLIDKF